MKGCTDGTRVIWTKYSLVIFVDDGRILAAEGANVLICVIGLCTILLVAGHSKYNKAILGERRYPMMWIFGMLVDL